MNIAKHTDGQWYVDGVEPYFVDGIMYSYYGPYETKAEAEDGRRGVQKTLDRIAKESK